MNHRRYVEWIEDRIVERPGRVVVLFLLLTLVFAGGLSNVETEAGTEQFAEDVPAQRALQNVNEEFSPPFEPDTGTTQLIHRGDDVLDRRALLRMLALIERIEERPDLGVESTSSAASVVARTIDPEATTTEEQIRAIERSTPREVDAAVRESADDPAFAGTVSTDFNRRDASASATIAVVTHEVPGGVGGGAGQGGSSPLTDVQREIQRISTSAEGEFVVFGSGIVADEFSTVISDSLAIVTPAAMLFIVLFLVVAYRDLLDLLLGGFALVMAAVWTFGFLGLAGIPFNQVMIAIPPLLLAVGIDFGIHAINRYREDRVEGAAVATDGGESESGRESESARGPRGGTADAVSGTGADPDADAIGAAMRRATDQLLIAFFIVTGTTVIGFLANLASDLIPIRDFGVVAAVGIVFTFLVFGIFLPAAKVLLDRNRDRLPIPTFSRTPLGSEGSRLGAVLRGGVVVARRAPVIFLVIALAFTAGSAWYATDVDTSFTQEDFLPPEETPAHLETLPEPFRPADYSVVGTLNLLEAKFETTQGGTVTVYRERRMVEDAALEEIRRAGEDPPDSFVVEDRRADEQSVVTVIRSHAERDPEFRRLVERNDRNGNGVPDDDLEEVYDYLLSSPARDEALQYLAEDYRSTRVVYSVEADASDEGIAADGRTVADRYRGDAVATGDTVVFRAVADLILASAIRSLVIALAGTVAFLVVVYGIVEGLPSLGVANSVPIAVAVAAVAGSMRLLDISFNAFTATILALTIGLGIDYSVHVTHRFVDERRERPLFDALDRTVRGTGGALAGSMLTTTFGIGVLVLSVLDVLGQFGILTALSVAYSFFASLLVLPSVLVVWDRVRGHDPDAPIGAAGRSPTGNGATRPSATGDARAGAVDIRADDVGAVDIGADAGATGGGA